MKKFINKKNVVIAVIVAILIGVSTYMLANKKSDVKPTSNKTSEVTTKEDNKNETKNDKKTDEKKNDKKEVKEDKKSDEKKSDTKVEETSTATETNTSDNNTSNVTETTNNSVSNNTASNTSYTQPANTPCVPTYTNVYHEAVGHYETQVVTPAWDEAIYEGKIVGGQTGRIYNSLDEFACQDADYSYSVKQVQVDTIHHEAETQQVWVVDQQAWTETVASGC